MAMYVRELTAEERERLTRLARAQTAPVRLARRAEIVLRSARRETAPAIARQLGLAEKTVRRWLERFDVAGLAGLDDAPRSGRPRTYTEEHRGRVIATARALPPKPEQGELPPTCHWTLDRLAAELNREGVPIKRSQIRRFLKAEHVKWQRPRTWLESDDPAFAEKRGPSSGSTPSRRPAAPSYA
jgi:transposase